MEEWIQEAEEEAVELKVVVPLLCGLEMMTVRQPWTSRPRPCFLRVQPSSA